MGGGTMHIDIDLPIIHDVRPSSSHHLLQPMKPSCSDTYCGTETGTKQELLAVNGEKYEKRASGSGSFFSSGFGAAPSQFEVQNAIAALLNFMQGITSSQSESQWLQHTLKCCVPLLSYGQRRVYDAFQLLQTDTCVKRLVVSLSSDKALWDAVTNNELVRKLQEPLFSGPPQNSNKEPELATCIVRWIMDITRAKVLELIETFQSLVNDVFLPPETVKENPAADDEDEFEEKVRSSLLLSVMILLIVVVTRFHGA